MLRCGSLLGEELLLAREAPAIAGEAAIAANDAVAGHDNRHGICGAGASHGTHGFRLTQRARHLGIRARGAAGNALQFLPDAALEGRGLQVQR